MFYHLIKALFQLTSERFKESFTKRHWKSNQIADYYSSEKCSAIYSGRNHSELFLETEWRNCSIAGCRNDFNDNLCSYVYSGYKFGRHLSYDYGGHLFVPMVN